MDALARLLHAWVPATYNVPLWIFAVLVMFASGLVVLSFAFVYAGLATYFERKIAADIQSRIGPNRVGPIGLLQFVADGVKLVFKEDIIPAKADKLLFKMAPYFVFIGSFTAVAVVPWGTDLCAADLDIGIYYVQAVTSLVIVGILLAGWSSNNKWALLGGMRAAAQIISYEIAVGMALIPVIVIAGTLSLQEMVRMQGGYGGIFGWFIWHDPFTFVSFFLYFLSALAQTNRAPFDLPEAESELVSGFHVEYSGMRFSFFFIAEYAEMYVVSAVATACFLGGWQVPFIDVASLPFLWANLLSVTAFLLKTLGLVGLMIWVRWTLPRLRVDQLMQMSWKYLVPLTIVNLLGTSLWILLCDGKGVPALIASAFGR